MTSEEVNDLLAVPGNNTCADCAPGGMALAGSGKVQRPLWASVNLGVVLSVQAAGVHRKLGVQTSKVLSLTMDEWTSTDYRGMMARGNATVNAELEASLPDGFPEVRKPSMHLDDAGGENGDGGDMMRELEAFVRAKYVSRSFIFGGDGAVEALDGGGGGGAAGAKAKAKAETTRSSSSGSAYMGATVEYTGMLCVRVVRGNGFPSMDVGSPSDPYAVVRLAGTSTLGHAGQEWRTKTVWNCNDPVWGESLMFNTGNLGMQTLEVCVWDQDVVKADDVIGVAKFPLSGLMDDDDDDGGGGGGGDGRSEVGAGKVKRVTLPLVKAEGQSSFMFRLFGCCAAPSSSSDLGTVTLELEFMPLNNE